MRSACNGTAAAAPTGAFLASEQLIGLPDGPAVWAVLLLLCLLLRMLRQAVV
jgi:hypothetical protein